MATLTGVLKGKILTLDEPVPPLEGKRVRVVLRSAEDDEVELSAEENARLWKEWVEQGPQGPIELDEDPDIT